MVTKADIPVALGIGSETITQVTGPRGGRKYVLTHMNGAPSAPSVTTITDGTLRNFGLETWRAGHIRRGLSEVIELAEARTDRIIDALDKLGNDSNKGNYEYTLEDVKKIFRAEGEVLTTQSSNKIIGAANEEAKRSALLGSELHTVLSLLLEEGSNNVSIPVHLQPAIRSFIRWRQQHSWEFVASEVAVYKHDRACSYAGTIDALFKDEWGDYILVDWKSSSGIYDSHLLQVAGYVSALQSMLNMSLNTGNTNGTHFVADDERTVPALVRGMVVRFKNSYPLTPEGGKDRTQDKVFEDGYGSLEYAWVDQKHWEPFWYAVYGLSQAEHRIDLIDL